MTTFRGTTNPHPIDETRSRAATMRIVAAGLIGALLALFAVLNSQTVRVHLIVTTSHVPMVVVIVVCTGLGAAGAWLVFRRRAARDQEA
jgi:uncharacterized integral membrane protein